MKRLALLLCAVWTAGAAEPIPRIVRDPATGAWRLEVNHRPFLILGAQVRNSSGWPSQLDDVWAQMQALHVNTVEIPLYWEQIEPRQGSFDFSVVDTIVEQARARKLRLVLLWFATWKNGQMDYAPQWVKRDPAIYPRMRNRAGQPVRVLSPHAAANLDADRRAFVALLAHLRQIDEEHRTVILMQVENEPGSLETARDYSPASNRLFESGTVPAVIAGLGKGRKSGTWTEVFGAEAEEAFAAYHTATFVNAVAEAGKRVYPLPMSVNVWLREEKTFQRPGEHYPSGGAVTNMLDLWKAVTPAIDVIAPDIYTQHYRNYQEVCHVYARKDNALLIPETGGSTPFARYLFYALADSRAIGFAPFGINAQDTKTLPDRLGAMAANFRLLGPSLAAIARLQGAGKLQSAVEEHLLTNRLLRFDGYEVVAMFGFPPQLSYGGLFAPGTKDTTGRALIGQLGPDEFLIAGFDTFVQFRPSRDDTGKEQTAQFLSVQEGAYDSEGEWKTKRLWNGDEAFFGLLLPAAGTTLRVRLTRY